MRGRTSAAGRARVARAVVVVVGIAAATIPGGSPARAGTPVPGAPTPPSGQLGQTNARARDAVTQRDSGGHGATRFTGVGSPLTPGGGRK